MSQDMLGNTFREFVGTYRDLNDKLLGKDGSQWLAAFKKFLRKENPWEGNRTAWEIYKTIKLGTQSKEDLRLKIGKQIHAEDLLRADGFVVSDTPQEVDLVVVQLYEIGFRDVVRDVEIICNRGLEFGLEPCPCDAGPQLFLQLGKGPECSLNMAMMPVITKPVSHSCEPTDSIFVVCEAVDSPLVIRSSRAHSYFHLDDRFVFVRPRK